MTRSQHESLDRLVAALRRIPSREGLMNPYHSNQGEWISPVADDIGPRADEVRCANLRAYLTRLLDAGSDVIFCGEAPSSVGQTWTGIAFTSEREVKAGAFPLDGCRLLPAAAGGARPLMEEASALYVWRALARMKNPAVLTNALSAHPFPAGDPTQNRGPTREEVALGRESLECLIELVRPRLVIALGRVAEKALKSLGQPAEYVRHPSFGGAPAMFKQLEEIGVIVPAATVGQRTLFDESSR